MWRVLTLGITLTLAPVPVAAQSGDALAPLRFLLGDWTAIDTPPGESGSFTFMLSVHDHVIVRTNEANYAAAAQRPASRHEDLLIIFLENRSLKANYFDSEGHVIRYAVDARESNHAVFISEPNAREPRYRLTYTAGRDGTLVGSFEVSPDGSSDAFKPYLSWKARKR